MYKLLAIDIDDTLLNDDMQITEPTRKALEQAIQQGVTVTLATGRMYASAKQIAKQLELDVPIITYQGALVKTLIEGQVIYERTVPSAAAAQVFQFCEQRGLHLQVYTDDILYAKQENEKVKAYASLTNVPYTIEPNFETLIDRPFAKMLIYDEPEVLDELIPELRSLLGDQAHITKSKPNFLEVMHPEGTKGHALHALARHYRCDISETIGVGDSWNDQELIRMAGLGVAMGNAIDSLKQIADYVTRTNNEDGVKHVIDKFILERV